MSTTINGKLYVEIAEIKDGARILKARHPLVGLAEAGSFGSEEGWTIRLDTKHVETRKALHAALKGIKGLRYLEGSHTWFIGGSDAAAVATQIKQAFESIGSGLFSKSKRALFPGTVLEPKSYADLWAEAGWPDAVYGGHNKGN